MKPKATVRLHLTHIDFRLDGIAHDELKVTVEYMKKLFPEMRWNGKWWRLPKWRFEQLRGLLMTQFKPSQIQFVSFLHDSTDEAHRQLPLDF